MKKTFLLSLFAATFGLFNSQTTSLMTKADSLITYDDSNSLIASQGFSQYSDPNSYNSTVHSGLPGYNGLIQAAFSDCTTISIFANTNSCNGIMHVYLDSTFYSDVDLYSESALYTQEVLSISNLEKGEHYVSITISDEKNVLSSDYWIAIDKFESDGTLIEKSFMPLGNSLFSYDDADSLVKSQGFSQYSDANSFCGTVHSGLPGYNGLIQVAFSNCTVISIFANKNNCNGIMHVYLDGTFHSDVDLYSESALYTQEVLSFSGLTKGEHYVSITISDDKNQLSSGNWIAIDKFESDGTLIEKSFMPLGNSLFSYDDADSLVKSQGFSQYSDANSFCGTVHSGLPGYNGLIQVAFSNCTVISIFANKNNCNGIMHIYLDGAFYSDVDLYSESALYTQEVLTITSLSKNVHFVSITISDEKNDSSSDYWIAIDKFESDGTLIEKEFQPLNDVLNSYDDADELIVSEGFSQYYDSNAYCGTIHSALYGYNGIIQAAFSDCTAISLFGGKSSNEGILLVYIDGVFAEKIDLYNAERIYTTKLFSINSLTKGEHFISVFLDDAKNPLSTDRWCEIDKFESDGTLVSKELLKIDPDAGNQVIDDQMLDYEGTWQNYTSLDPARGFYKNTASSTTEENAKITFIFMYCESIKWYSSLGESYGIAGVYIDGKFAATINTGIGSSPSTCVFDSGELIPGKHKIEIVKKIDDGKYIEVDKLVGGGINILGEDFVMATSKNFFSYTGKVARTSDSYLVTSNPGDKIYFTFVGEKGSVEILPSDGKVELIFDYNNLGIVDFSDKTQLFSVDNLSDNDIHHLEIRLISGTLTITGGKTKSLTSASSLLNDLAYAELTKIQNGEKEILDKTQWNPVSLQTKLPFDGVKLNEGVLSDAFNKEIDYLKYCYSQDNYVDETSVWTDILTGSNEGRILAGSANALRWVEDAELENIVSSMVDVIKNRAEPNGWCMPYSEDRFSPYYGDLADECRNYDRVMFTKGLLAAGAIGYDDAYTLIRNFYDYFEENYGPTLLSGSLGTQGSIGSILAYESAIGKPEDIYFNMKYYDMDWWLDSLAKGIRESIYAYPLNRPHSYLLTSLESFLGEYVATGDTKYLDAVLGGWKIFHDNYENIGGGIDICESNDKYYPGTHTLDPNKGCYETCGNVFWTELNSRLLQLFPTEEKYASEIEKSIYNILLSSQQSDDGRIRYYNLYNNCKFHGSAQNTCCEIMATTQLSSLPQYIYSVSDDSIFVNLFANSDIETMCGNQEAKFSTNSNFPYDNNVEIICNNSNNVKLNVRVPSWNKGNMQINVNGTSIGSFAPGCYAEIDREWKKGDKVTFTLLPELKSHNYTGVTNIENYDRACFTYGPILLAATGTPNIYFDTENGNSDCAMKFDISAHEFLNGITFNPNTLEFVNNNYPSNKLVPYFTIQNGVPFSVFSAYSIETHPESNVYLVNFDYGIDNKVIHEFVTGGNKVGEVERIIRYGYSFDYWYVDDPSVPFDFNTEINSDLTLHAKWNPNKFTAEFITNGGSAIENQEIYYDSKVIKPSDPTREDDENYSYTFAGWFVDEACTNPFDFDENVRGGCKIYAKWIATQITYNVVFDTNGGNNINSISINKGGILNTPDNPVKEGFTFAGWYMDEELTTKFDFSNPVNENLTLYAKWEFDTSKNNKGCSSSIISSGTLFTICSISSLVALLSKKKKKV